VACQTRKNQEGIKDLHRKNNSYSSEGLDINKASDSNHSSNVKKHNDVMKRRVRLD